MIDILLIILAVYVGWFGLILCIWLFVAGLFCSLAALEDPKDARDMFKESFFIYPVMIGLCWPAMFFVIPLGLFKMVRGR